MAEFVQTMKDWRRMCKAQDDIICGECSSCPLGDDGKSCMAVYEDEFDAVDFAHIEQTVAEWAAEHPVVYPTWAEWLVDRGVFPQMMSTIPSVAFNTIRDSLSAEIPADIAQKLGIEPKEGI